MRCRAVLRRPPSEEGLAGAWNFHGTAGPSMAPHGAQSNGDPSPPVSQYKGGPVQRWPQSNCDPVQLHHMARCYTHTHGPLYHREGGGSCLGASLTTECSVPEYSRKQRKTLFPPALPATKCSFAPAASHSLLFFSQSKTPSRYSVVLNPFQCPFSSALVPSTSF